MQRFSLILNGRFCRSYCIRVDDDLKSKSDQLFKDLGTDTTSAIRMFLTQAVANNGFPFEIKRTVHNPYTSMIEDEMLQRLEQSREYSKREITEMRMM